MKPKNRIICPDCGKPKMLFETERKANDFIKWNGEEMEFGKELRVYYCPSCCGWHISHQKHRKSYDKRTDNLIGAYHRSKKSTGKIEFLIHRDSTNVMQQNIEREAAIIYDDIPEQIKTERKKNLIKRYLTTHFADKGIKDDGRLRQEVYRLFYDDIYERFNNLKVKHD